MGVTNRYYDDQPLGLTRMGYRVGWRAAVSPDTGVASEQIRDWSAALSHFLSTYRWELWLVVGIPAIAFVVGNAVNIWGSALSTSDLQALNLTTAISSVFALLLLAVFYPRVRALGREFLLLLWSYFIIKAAIGVVAGWISYLGTVDMADSLFRFYWTFWVLLFAQVPAFLVLLWFSRQASKLSLSHAYFLVVLTTFAVSRPLSSSLIEGSVAAIVGPILVTGTMAFSLMILKAWLLGDFDKRGPGFQRNAILSLMAAAIAFGYVRVLLFALFGYGTGEFSVTLPLLDSVAWAFGFLKASIWGLALLFVVLALVYLVRVRQPRTEAPLPEGGTQ